MIPGSTVLAGSAVVTTSASSVLVTAAVAQTAGFVLGAVLFTAVAVVMIVGGLRIRRRGTAGAQVAGIVLVVLGALLVLGALANLAGGTTAP